MTFQEFIDKYLGQKKGYPDGSYVGQCLSICKLYIKECFGINPPPSGTNSAYGYWSNFPSPLDTVFKKVLNYKDTIPEEGWIVVWKPWTTNQWGHIAIVGKGSTTKDLINYAQNWTSKVFQEEINSYNNVIGYLVPKDNMTKDQQQAMTKLEKFKSDKDHGNLEGAVDDLLGAYKDFQILKGDVDDLKVSLNALEEKIVEINLKLEDKDDLLAISNKELKTAKQTISKLSEDLELYRPYKSRYESKCLETADKLNSYELFKLLINKLFPPWKK